MRLSFLLTFVAALSIPVVAVPSVLKSVQRYQGETTGQYIVTFKSGSAQRSWAKKLGAVQLDIINGVASSLDDETLNALRASEEVESISEDGIMHALATQVNAPWHLVRIGRKGPLIGSPTGNYTYPDSAGAGVDIYILDTGVYTAHSQFGGRAIWGASFVGGTTDGHGHGTHCAGLAGGIASGVAKRANIIAVQVLNASGSGSVSGIVNGLNWVKTRAASIGRPSVVSMSLGGSASSALDSAVASLTSSGIHVVVAAGNSNANVAGFSPAREPSAITVGATAMDDSKAPYSNYGTLIDIFAPGSNIVSTWIGSTTAMNTLSGTSMATPIVAGVVAVYISEDGNISPAAMATKIRACADSGPITGLPSGTYNGIVQVNC